MKAHEIFMYLLTFNLAFFLISWLGLYFTSVYNYNFTLEAVDAFAALVGSLASYAVINYFSNRTQPSPQYVIYGVYGTLFITTFTHTTTVFLTISNMLPFYVQAVFNTIFLLIFGGLSAWAFYFGMMQLVTGGWRFMK